MTLIGATLLLEKAEAGDAGAIASLNAYKLMAIRARTDEQMGLVMPSDVYVEPQAGEQPKDANGVAKVIVNEVMKRQLRRKRK